MCTPKDPSLKKIIPVIVLLAFLAGSGGYFFIFKIEQYVNYHSIEKEITNRSNKIDQQVLVFKTDNITGIKWLKKQKEFIYNNQMYDVVSYKCSGKYIFYYCINDTKEKKLIADFEKKNHANDRTNQISQKLIQTHFIVPSALLTIFRQPIVCCYFLPIRKYLPPINNTLSPPPKVIRIA